MKKIIYITTLFLLSVACSEEFLDRPKLATPSSANFYNLEENVDKAVNAIYNVTRGEQTYGRAMWVLGSIASDETEAGGEVGGGDQMKIQNIDRFFHHSNNGIVAEVWYGFYAGIYRANIVIDKVTGNENLDEEFRKKVLGQAYTLRALFYFELVKIFGGVPLILEIKGADELAIPRSSVKETFSAIEQDLQTAMDIDKFPEKWTLSSDEGRVSAGAAKALLVKLLVFESSYATLADDPNNIYTGCENRWTEARVLAEEVIADTAKYGFGLEPDFNKIWRIAGEQSPEHIIKANALRIEGYTHPGVSEGSGASYPGGLGLGTIASAYTGSREYYNGAVVTEDYNLGYGFNIPTPELYGSYSNGDPRRDMTFIEDMVDTVNLEDAGGNKQTFFYSTQFSPTNYAYQKYVPTLEEWDNTSINTQAGPLDYKIFRFSELLLLAAEANIQDNNETRATELVNMVRQRAANSGVTGFPAALPTVTYDDIIEERKLELAGEGHRFFDLVRVGKADEVLNGLYNYTIKSNLEFFVDKHTVFPIPVGEIARSGNVIKQNPGY